MQGILLVVQVNFIVLYCFTFYDSPERWDVLGMSFEHDLICGFVRLGHGGIMAFIGLRE